MADIKLFGMEHYREVYALWERTPGVGLNEINDSREGIEKFIGRNPLTSFVAVEEGKVIGSVLGGNDGRRGFVYHLCVDADYRRKGVGKALVERVLEALKDEGINRASLVCLKWNESGNTFWQAMGWERRDDIVYYTKNLT